MGTSRPETHILDSKIYRTGPKNQEPTRKCDIYTNMDPKYLDPTRNIKEPKKIQVLMGTRKVNPNRPGPGKTRPGTDPKFLKYLYGSKFSGPERLGPEKT